MRRTKTEPNGKPKKLGVDRTTLRTLDRDDLAQVAGGTKNSGKLCNITHGPI